MQTAGEKSVTETLVSEVGTGNQREILRTLFERSGMCMARLDGGVRLVEVNADFSRQFGCLPMELGGRCFADLLHADVRTLVSRQFTRLLAERGSRFTEPMVAFHQKDSTVFSGELTGFSVRGSGSGSGSGSLMVLVCPQGGSRKGRSAASHRLALTEIEARILEGVALGVSTVNLAATLYLSRGGVSYHVDILMRRLKVKNRPALVSKAYSIGLIRPGWPPRVHPDYLALAGPVLSGARHPAGAAVPWRAGHGHPGPRPPGNRCRTPAGVPVTGQWTSDPEEPLEYSP
jgi:PAS domain S-box-containing protein